MNRVYPRACGETGMLEAPALLDTGLSPRLRGNPRWLPFGKRISGSIPALAGKP